MCILECGPDLDCYRDTCCAGKEAKGIPPINEYDNVNFRASETGLDTSVVPMHDRKMHDPNVIEKTQM